jgi:spore maturation protein CgeB
MENRKILFVGEQWFGSDSRSLAFAFRRASCILATVDPGNFLPQSNYTIGSIANKLLRPLHLIAFNRAILDADSLLKPDLVAIFKGWGISPSTLDTLKHRNRLLIQYYPDVSLFTHGKWIPKCVPKFDYWFTTKSFGIEDVKKISHLPKSKLINHAFDPDVHRPPIAELAQTEEFDCDVSFVGTWDKEKENELAELVCGIPSLRLKIWGGNWERATRPELAQSIQHTRVVGDLFAKSMHHSLINLALLSGQKEGASSGDQVTARTFQIPAVGGFMLHKRTPEALGLFSEDLHAAYFGNTEEMIAKVKHYLTNSSERETIRQNGCLECHRNHSMDNRVYEILRFIDQDLEGRVDASLEDSQKQDCSK